MIRKGNVTIGLQTRFGPGWTGIRCGARTKLGGECQRPAVKKTGRCTRHGGKSTGPRTQAGRNKIAALHTTHGKYTKTKRQEAQKSAEAEHAGLYNLTLRQHGILKSPSKLYLSLAITDADLDQTDEAVTAAVKAVSDA